MGNELLAADDDLSEWAGRRSAAFFLPPDERLLPSLEAIAAWVRGQRFRTGAIGAFLEDADYFLVAHAHAYGYVVVTHEVPSDGVRQVKIPNVAIGVKLRCMTPYEMLRIERARFVLAPT